MKTTFICQHCGKSLPRDPRIKRQKYCSSLKCQNARKRLFDLKACAIKGKLLKKESLSNDSQLLPIPATFIIDEKGIKVWRQFDPKYKNRPSVKEIIDISRQNQISKLNQWNYL